MLRKRSRPAAVAFPAARKSAVAPYNLAVQRGSSARQSRKVVAIAGKIRSERWSVVFYSPQRRVSVVVVFVPRGTCAFCQSRHESGGAARA